MRSSIRQALSSCLAVLIVMGGAGCGPKSAPETPVRGPASAQGSEGGAQDLDAAVGGGTATHPVAFTSTQQAAFREQLEAIAKAPYGTGAALSVSVGEAVAHFSAGALWEGGPATSAESLFNVASVSKLLTAAKVHALAHAGRLALTDTVAKHLPGVKLLDVNDKQSNLAGSITLAQLLSHSAGLPHVPPNLDPTAVNSSWDDPALLKKLTKSWEIQLVKAPGKETYSNLGYALIGAIVEKLESANFPDAMAPLLGELKLTPATFWPMAFADDSAARGRVEIDGKVQFHLPSWYASPYALPFNGLWISAQKLHDFGRALLVAAKDVKNPLHKMTQFEGVRGYGLGPVFTWRQGLRSIEHDGGGQGFTAQLLMIPERDLSIALVCNSDGDDLKKVKAVLSRVDIIVDVALAQK
jgi:D-alanyl-D-alanine carboxypeptidase